MIINIRNFFLIGESNVCVIAWCKTFKCACLCIMSDINVSIKPGFLIIGFCEHDEDTNFE